MRRRDFLKLAAVAAVGPRIILEALPAAAKPPVQTIHGSWHNSSLAAGDQVIVGHWAAHAHKSESLRVVEVGKGWMKVARS